MDDEFLENLIRSAAPRETPDSLRVRIAEAMAASAGRRVRPSFRHRPMWWSLAAATAAAASWVLIFRSPFSTAGDLPPRVAVQAEMRRPPVLLQTRTVGRSEPAGNIMVGSRPYQVMRNSEINFREYNDETLGKIEAYSYSNISYEAEPLVIR